MELKLLTWDSEFFKIRIGRLNLHSLSNIEELTNTLLEAKNTGYNLIYLFASPGLALEKYFEAGDFEVTLVDTKVTFCRHSPFTNTFPVGVEVYQEEIGAYDTLLKLAYASGEYSRFRLDEKLPPQSFERLYKTWLDNSIGGAPAQLVYVYRDGGAIEGMVTLSFADDDTSRIGLIGVDNSARGKGIGTALINACLHTSETKGVKKLLVPTQLNNKQACNFYRKNGFEEYSREDVYHVWL